MRVAIMGCGPGGSYLYRLLRERRPEVVADLFDEPWHGNRCGIKSCAWVVSFREFSALCSHAEIYPGQYITGRSAQVIVNNIKINADIVAIDKPALIAHLMGGNKAGGAGELNAGLYDRIIDATGRRAYLPAPATLPIVDTAQVRCAIKDYTVPTGFINKDGYSWLLPLGNGTAHVGALSTRSADAAKREMEKLIVDAESVECTCYGRIRMGGVITPFVSGNVWGLGESIGVVDPLTGMGITPAMDSARIMVEHWHDPAGYEREVLAKYAYTARASAVGRSLAIRKKPRILDALYIRRKASQITGIYPGVISIIRLLLTTRKNRF